MQQCQLSICQSNDNNILNYLFSLLIIFLKKATPIPQDSLKKYLKNASEAELTENIKISF